MVKLASHTSERDSRAMLVRISALFIQILIIQEALNQHQNYAFGAQLLANPDQSIQSTTHHFNSTANLSTLVNRTTSAISNKTLESFVEKTTVKDDWTFDRVEYDLMDFLQDLGTRYRLNNQSEPIESSPAPDDVSRVKSPLKASAAVPVRLSSSLPPTSTTDDNRPYAQPGSTLGQQPLSAIIPPKPDKWQAPSHNFPSTPLPEMFTSLASDDQDIGESSWQYGIFDRFTRPKSTTTTLEPIFESDANTQTGLKSLNSAECGLRTYEVNTISKQVSQDAYDPESPLNMKESNFKKQGSSGFSDSFVDYNNNNNNNVRQHNHQGSPPPCFHSHRDHNTQSEKDAYESYKQNSDPNGGGSGDPPSSDSTGDSEFNLVLRRQWMQQQLGNTLQALGYNATNQSTAAETSTAEHLQPPINDQAAPAPLTWTLIENLMKKKVKLGKASKSSDHHHANATQNEWSAFNRRYDSELEARVIGGNDAVLGDSPWSVSLQALVSRPGTEVIEYRHYCGGTIISERYILTAAHCLDFMVGRESRLFIVAGDLNWRMKTTSPYGRRWSVDKLVIHSGYKSTAFGHDIGLIKTKERMRPLKVNGRYIINSACLPESGAEHSGDAELVGWGLFSNRNEMAGSLQIADVPILPRPLCIDLYRRRTGLIQWLIGVELITDKQICAGTFGRGICQGDSGSSLVMNERASIEQKGVKAHDQEAAQMRATVVGVVAFGGIRRCSYQSLPGVYMQTSKYMDWILPRIQRLPY